MGDSDRCRICCISKNFPGVFLSEDGICKECLLFNSSENPSEVISKNLKNIEEAIENRRGKHKYDVIVAYSGGKDSSFALLHLKNHYNLNVLAYLVDNNFVAEQAKINADTFTRNLGVDLITFKPNSQFMNKMYRKSLDGDFYDLAQLSRASAACLSCINLINNFVLDESIRRSIPIIAGGYIEGQIPIHSGVVKMDTPILQSFRDKNRKKLSEKIDSRFNQYLDIANPGDGDLHPIFINPLLGINYSEREIIEIISPFGWKKPADTGRSSSNCLLNDYAIAVHFKRYKFHPYEAEICAQVRRGTLTKKEALEKLEDVDSPASFNKVLQRLED